MNKPKYQSSMIGLCIMFGFLIFFLVLFIILKAHLLIILLPGSLIVIYLAIIIFNRKSVFSKVLVNDEGITTYYRNKIIYSIKWEDIKDAEIVYVRVGRYSSSYRIKLYVFPMEEWKYPYPKDTCIEVDASTPFYYYLFDYKHKIPVRIRDEYYDQFRNWKG